ncbi:MAG: condensation domain-containing protein [Candidatus Methanofastidiosia archaeon]|jgi:NRPS condensation-like uncharacterized protein
MNRALGANERVVWLSSEAGGLNFSLMLRVSGDIDEYMVRKALDLLTCRHPLLNVRIEIQNGNPVFTSENVPKIPLRVNARNSKTQWYTEVEKEINHPFPCFEGPLMRAVFLKGAAINDILLTHHHVIGDGTSSMYLVRDFLHVLGEVAEGNKPDVQPLPERPSIEELLPESAHGFKGLIKTGALLEKQVKSILIQRPEKLAKESTPSKTYHGRNIHCMLSPEETESLLAKCREESTTVHGALCASVFRATADQICSMHSGENSKQKQIQKPVTVSCLSPVDIRHFLNPPLGEEVGFYASTVITTHRIDKNTTFWDLARSVQESVHRSIESGEPFVSVSLLDKLVPKSASSSTITKRVYDIYPVALLVSNAGRFTTPEKYGPLTLKEFHVAFANKAAPEILTFIILTYRNRLVLNFSYTEPTISHQCAAAVAENTVKMLKSVT